MAKLVKTVLLLAVLVVIVVVAVKYFGGRGESTSVDQKPAAKNAAGVQPQEKYGFAPVGDE